MRQLSDMACRKAAPADKPRRMFDGRGLYLEVSPAGGKLWRLKYRFDGKERRLALGKYPEVSLTEARKRREEARELVAKGIDPGQAKKDAKARKRAAVENTFEAVANAWLGRQNIGAVTRAKIEWILREKLNPYLGARAVGEIEPPELLAALRRCEAAGILETTRRARSVAGRVFRYAVACGFAQRDPSRDLQGALASRRPVSHPAVTDPETLGELLRAIEGSQASFVVKSALRLAPMVFVRPGELRSAAWSEIDLESGAWSIPDARMKMRKPHIVPLARQAVEILREVHAATGPDGFVFPASRGKGRPMSENTLAAALAGIGWRDRQSAHGFRATARTLLDEALGFRVDWIEHQLAHEVKDPLGRAYNRTQHLPDRRRMMQAWADYLETLRRSNQPPAGRGE
ncbi:integrase arm-type DNA-binding domain-containing protein [uncultured Aquimonas sp.]|uniref:tyrosine-type recombinase/integrase n=1 Tax=uncultured Aquimonas sp. TaxID=385483 RepID=UPI00086E4BCE|nr:integrase arm-type DNA-binding domain-containing protein [uncultured Aquimonas sp.]ODU48346.1 MAG: integrase [Xanthomonadaceae bacterium SCN 69-123]